MTDNSALSRLNMVRNQVLPVTKVGDAFLETMLHVPRELFVPESLQGAAYVDGPLPLSADRYLMPVSLFAKLASLIHIRPTDTILDIAPATGYSSAVFSKLCQKVFALEANQELASTANHLIHQLDINNVITISGNFIEGYPEAAPYNIIFINGAVSHIPETLTNQLAEGGRLIAILCENALPYLTHRQFLGRIVVIERLQNTLSKKFLSPTSCFLLPNF